MINKAITKELITDIYYPEKLCQLKSIWHELDTERLEEYFRSGGQPYIHFPCKIIHNLCFSRTYIDLPYGSVGLYVKDERTIPLPFLMLRKHFLNYDGSPDLRRLEAYTKMLDLCEQHGLDINATDSLGISMFIASLACLSVFEKLCDEYENESQSRPMLRYRQSYFDYMTSTILLRRGFNPFQMNADTYSANNMTQLSAALFIEDIANFNYDNSNLYVRDLNLYYNELIHEIICNCRSFEVSPFCLKDQTLLVKNIIKAYFSLAKNKNIFEEPAKALDTLDLILKKNIASTESLQSSKKSNEALTNSVMYSMLAHVSNFIDTAASTGIDCVRRDNLLEGIGRILSVLQYYGADINIAEKSGLCLYMDFLSWDNGDSKALRRALIPFLEM